MEAENKVPIVLVDSASSYFLGESHEILSRSGYTNIEIAGWDNLRCEDIDQCMKVIVIPFDYRSTSSEKIHSVLKRIRKMPVLGVIKTHEKPNDDFLIYCSEFLCWPFSETEFALRIERLLKKYRPERNMADDVKYLEDFVDLNMVGTSPLFVQVLRQIKKIARCDATVLIEGETGTGKEMAARAVHYLSDRRDFPFIPVNCGAIPDNLLENELFGHEKGAYTDAKNAQKGLVWQADRGTIFFDEVETFSPKGQFVLLRFLEDLVFKPLGSEKLRKADVRITAASNEKLQDLVDQGRFRKDLFYRIDIMSIELPPLSQRTGDIELLAEYFLNKYKRQYGQPEKKLSPETIQWMENYNWPGNIRELENLIHRTFLLTDGPIIHMDRTVNRPKDRRINSPDRRQKPFIGYSLSEAKKKMVDQFEKKYLTRLIREADGNVTKAAKLAGKERRTLGKLLKKHNIRKNTVINPS